MLGINLGSQKINNSESAKKDINSKPKNHSLDYDFTLIYDFFHLGGQKGIVKKTLEFINTKEEMRLAFASPFKKKSPLE